MPPTIHSVYCLDDSDSVIVSLNGVYVARGCTMFHAKARFVIREAAV